MMRQDLSSAHRMYNTKEHQNFEIIHGHISSIRLVGEHTLCPLHVRKNLYILVEKEPMNVTKMSSILNELSTMVIPFILS